MAIPGDMFSGGMWGDNGFTLLQCLFLPDGTREAADVFLLWKGTFCLSKCDGCVESPNLEHVQNTWAQHLKSVSV